MLLSPSHFPPPVFQKKKPIIHSQRENVDSLVEGLGLGIWPEGLNPLVNWGFRISCPQCFLSFSMGLLCCLFFFESQSQSPNPNSVHNALWRLERDFQVARTGDQKPKNFYFYKASSTCIQGICTN